MTGETKRQGAYAATISLVGHVLFLVVLAAIQFSLASERPLGITTAVLVDDPAQSEIVQQVSLKPLVQDTATESVSVASDVKTDVLDVSDLSSSVALTAFEAADSSLLTATVPAVGASSDGPVGPSGGQRGGSGKGDRSNPPNSFFGLPIEGKKVVYLIDASSSMLSRFESREGSRIGRVKRELLWSVRSLDDDKQWSVIFFNTDAAPLPTGKKRYVPRENERLCDQAMFWIRDFQPAGSTDPTKAFRIAFERLQPDTIICLTDGEFPQATPELIAKSNHDDVVIHTVGLAQSTQRELTEPMLMLIRIALENQGYATFISNGE